MKKISLIFTATIVLLSGCATKAKLERLEQYRKSANLELSRRQHSMEIANIANRDPNFAAIDKKIKIAELEGRSVIIPKIDKVVEPEYPYSARVNYLEAVLDFALIVNEKGVVTKILYIDNPHLKSDPIFITPAEVALKQWVFRPAEIDGKPSDYVFIAPVRFLLKLN